MRDSQIIEAYTAGARPLMLRWMPLNSCIGAARVTVDYLERHGIEARVQSCKFMVEWMDRKLAYTSGLTDEERAGAITERKAYGDGWNGHLLVIAANRWIIDPSFDQALVALGTAPDSKMFVCESDSPAMRSGAPLELEFQGVADSGELLKIRYIPLFDDTWQATEAWNDIGLPFLVSEIAAKLGQRAGPRTAAGNP